MLAWDASVDRIATIEKRNKRGVLSYKFSMKMKLSKVGLVFYYSLLCCVTRGPFNGRANAENALEHNSESIPNEDTPQYHNQKHERR